MRGKFNSIFAAVGLKWSTKQALGGNFYCGFDAGNFEWYQLVLFCKYDFVLILQGNWGLDLLNIGSILGNIQSKRQIF